MGSTKVNDLLRDEGRIEMFFHTLVYCRKGVEFGSPRSARRFLFMLKKKLGIKSSCSHLIKVDQLITEHETLWVEVMIKELESDKPTITVRLNYYYCLSNMMTKCCVITLIRVHVSVSLIYYYIMSPVRIPSLDVYLSLTMTLNLL